MAIELPKFPASDEPGIDELNRRTAVRTEIDKQTLTGSNAINTAAILMLSVAPVLAIAGFRQMHSAGRT